QSSARQPGAFLGNGFITARAGPPAYFTPRRTPAGLPRGIFAWRRQRPGFAVRSPHLQHGCPCLRAVTILVCRPRPTPRLLIPHVLFVAQTRPGNIRLPSSLARSAVLDSSGQTTADTGMSHAMRGPPPYPAAFRSDTHNDV